MQQALTWTTALLAFAVATAPTRAATTDAGAKMKACAARLRAMPIPPRGQDQAYHAFYGSCMGFQATTATTSRTVAASAVPEMPLPRMVHTLGTTTSKAPPVIGRATAH